MRFGISSLLVMVSSALAAADASEMRVRMKELASGIELSATFRDQIENKTGDARAQALKPLKDAIEDVTRLSCALACDAKIPEDESVLRELLDDPAPFVRCAAARGLWGVDANSTSRAEKHRFANVLAAEQTAREILRSLDKIPSLTAPEQFAATRKLIGLGMDALLEIRKHFDHERNSVTLTAMYAWMEIVAARKNIVPEWHARIEKRLTEKVTLEFLDAPLLETVKFISKLVDVPIRVIDPKPNERLNLRVTDMSSSHAIEWTARLVDRDVKLMGGEVVLVKIAFNCGVVNRSWLLDARDVLERHGEAAVMKAVAAADTNDLHKAKFEIWNGFVIGEGLEPIGVVKDFSKSLDALRSKP